MYFGERYAMIVKEAKERARELQERGLLHLISLEGLKGKVRDQTRQQNMAELRKYGWYRRLEAEAVQIIQSSSSISPEQAAAQMCRGWLEGYPEAYARLQHMRFVG